MKKFLSISKKVIAKLFMRNSSYFSGISMPKSSALDVLGLCGSPSMEEIKNAYFMLSKRYHPDINQDNIEKFKEISEAYSVLKRFFTGEGNENEKHSFSVQNPHFNSYDGKLNEEDVEAFQRNQKENKYCISPD